MSEQRSDLELVEAANGGDRQAFEAIYHRYRDWVLALAWRFVRDRDMALDVAQETFIYLLGKFPGFTLTAQFKTFLYPVVRHLAISHRGKGQRFPQTSAVDGQASDLLDTIPAASDGSPHVGQGDDAAEGTDLAVVLAGLSEEHRETVVLRFVEGLSLEEVAQAMQVPLGTVKSRLHHALGRLREDESVRRYFDP